MSAQGDLRAVEEQVAALRAHADAAVAAAEPRAEALCARVRELELAIAEARRLQDEESEHFSEVLETLFAMAALDFTRRAPVRGDTPLDALAMSMNMLAEEIDAAQTRLVEAAVAKAASQAKSRFLAQMSHEIRTPLTALLGFAELLAAPSLSNDDRRKYATIVTRNGEHLLAVVNDVLDLSKIEAGKLQLEIVECSFASLLGDVESLLRVRASDRGLAFEVRLESSVPATVRTDPTRLRQVLLNVVGNAIKFTQAGSVRVDVAYEPGGDELRIRVVDTGIGMSQEQLGRIFQPFEQAGPATTRSFGGSGLGLAIAHEMIDALGGSIEARSELGRGSTFEIVLPARRPDGTPLVRTLAEVHRSDEREPAPPPRLVGSVLVADDGPDNQLLLVTLLRSYGLAPTVAEDGAVAVDAVTEAARAGRPFDLVLMDMDMPVLDGYEATRRLRSEGYALPIVALTAHAMDDARGQCLAAGCDEYVRKPIDRAELLAVLTRWLATAEEPAPITSSAAAPASIVSAFAGDPAMGAIVARFVASLPDRVAAMRAHLRGGASDRAPLQRLAHQLKGVGASYGFPQLTSAAADVERTVAAGGDLETVARAVEALAALAARIRPGPR